MNEMNLSECTGTRGNTRLLEHKSKVIDLSCSPSELSQCQQGLCRKCTQPSPAWGMQCQSLSRQEKLLSWVSQGNTSCSLPPPAPPWALTSISDSWDCSKVGKAPFKPPWAAGDGASSVPHTVSIASPTPPNQKSTGLSTHAKSTLPPRETKLFLQLFFFFFQEDPSAPHPIPTGQEQKLLFLM